MASRRHLADVRPHTRLVTSSVRDQITEQTPSPPLSLTARPTFRISYIYGVDPEGPEREVRIKNLETSGVSVVESSKSRDVLVAC